MSKTILVTGASRGIGLEFVKQLLKQPASDIVIAACRNPDSCEALQTLAKGNQSLKLIKLDVEQDDDIDAAVAETKKLVGDNGLNLLINNVAIYVKDGRNELRQASRTLLQHHFNVNVSSPIIMVQKFLPLLEEAAARHKQTPMGSNRATVVNISSEMSSQKITLDSGLGTSFQYKCTKTAVTMATILMSRELKQEGILVLALDPGWVKTDMGGQEAPLTPEESISGCIKVISDLNEENSGKLMNYNGDFLPF